MSAGELLNTISSVIGVLNNVEVKGKQNLANLHGAITLLEEICNVIMQPDQRSDTKQAETKETEER